jgi:hypothetical protein
MGVPYNNLGRKVWKNFRKPWKNLENILKKNLGKTLKTPAINLNKPWENLEKTSRKF